MTEKATVYFGEHLNALTDGLKGNSISGRINRTAERYSAIVDAHCIPLTDGEKEVLRRSLKWITGEQSADITQIRFLSDNIASSVFKDSPDAQSLIEAVRDASFADLVATVEKMGY